MFTKLKDFIKTAKNILLFSLNPTENVQKNEVVVNEKSRLFLLHFFLINFIISCSTILIMIFRSKIVYKNYDTYAFKNMVSIDTITEIINTDVIAYSVSLLLVLTTTILFLSGLVYFISKINKNKVRFKQAIFAVCFSWGPMLILALFTLIFTSFIPYHKVITSHNFLDYFVSNSFKENTMYQLLIKVDLFYLWTLVILSLILAKITESKLIRWLLPFMVIWILPFAISAM